MAILVDSIGSCAGTEVAEGIDYNRFEPLWFEAIFGFCRWGVMGDSGHARLSCAEKSAKKVWNV